MDFRSKQLCICLCYLILLAHNSSTKSFHLHHPAQTTCTAYLLLQLLLWPQLVRVTALLFAAGACQLLGPLLGPDQPTNLLLVVGDGRSLEPTSVSSLPRLTLGTGKRWVLDRLERTFPADHLLAVVLGRQSLERGLNDTAAETEDEVEGRFLLRANRSASFSSGLHNSKLIQIPA